MKNVKSLNLKKITSLLLAGATAFTLSSCGTVEMSSLTTKDLLEIEDVKDATLIDELIDAGKLKSGEESTIVEQADKLERYMNIVDKTSSIDLTGVDELIPLTEDEEKKVLEMSDEELATLIEQAKSKEKDLKSLENRIIALKKIYYLNKYCNEWIKVNGRNISIDFMIAAVKASVACELGLEPDEYSQVSIPALLSHNPERDCYIIEVGDKNYIIKSSTEELWNTIDYIYTVQSANHITDETRFPTFRKALNYAKTTIAAGCSVKDDKLEERYSSSHIEENFVPKQK